MKRIITLVHQKLMLVFLSGMVLFAGQCTYAQQLAFPGAEGFGKYATGGRTGSVYHVTNLNNTGTGSLRDAVSVANRIVVFDVAGVIKITDRIVVSSNIYLAGQTAPGEGITVYGNGWSFSNANNTICRYMKIRMGEVGTSGKDANGIADGHDMIFDHCSISWGRDETFSINAPDALNITIQNTAMTQGLLTHSAGGLIQTNGGVTLYRNLYADNGTRNNKLKGVNQYVNNIVYNWSAGAYIMGGDSEGESFSNAVSNLFIQGPIPGTRPFSVGNNKYHIYATDNLHDSDHNGVFNPYIIQQSEFGGGPDFQATPYAYPILPTIAANTLLAQSLPTVGASLPYRDFVDYYVVNEVKSLGIRGQFIGNETALPFGVPSSWYLWPGVKRTDTDNDGMPDDWETANGLNPNLASDAMLIKANGYTNIENFINGIDASYSQTYLRAPLSLVMDSATQNSISLSWYDYTEKEQGYIVEQKINGVFTKIGQTVVNGNTFTVTGLIPEEKDTFRVKAFSGANFSNYSNELAAKSKPVPVLVIDPNSFVPDLVWTGTANQNWDKTTANWTKNSVAANFTDSSKLLFGIRPSSQTINLAAQMGAKDILVRSDSDYTFQGVGYIAGSASVNKYGTGKLSLFTNNTYTAATVIAGGTLEINKLANGGLPSSIGASLPYAFNWVWKGGKINYTGGTTSTDRNVSLDANTEFSVANAASISTMYGVVSGGGGLIKSGLGTMVLRNINPYVGETVIKKGTLEVTPLSIATDAQNIIIGGVALGTSNILRLQGGTFKTSGGSSVANEDYPMHIYVEGSDTSGLMPNRLADLNGNVSGSGTLLYTIPYLREIIKGDWSEYTGTLIAYGSNATDGSILMIDNGGNGDGIPNGRVVATGNTKICTYSNNLFISFGGLSTDQTGVKLSCGGSKNIGFGSGFTTYSIGGANTDETFKGIINNELYGSATANDGTTTIIKEGDGLWRLTGTNTYSGTTTVIGGKLIVNGTHSGAGAFTVTEGVLAGKGSIAANVEVADTLQPGDNSIDKLTLKGKLTLGATSVTQIDINKSTTTTLDNMAVAGAIVYGGRLQISFVGTPVAGDVFKIFTIGSTQSGNFTGFSPATPGPGLQWQFLPYTGELLVVTTGFVAAPTNIQLTATSVDVPVPNSIVNITWQDNSNNEDYFVIERSADGTNFTDIFHTVPNATTYTNNTGLSPSTTYYYRIKAHGGTQESTYGTIVSIKTPSVQTAPISPTPANGLKTVSLVGGKVSLGWTGDPNSATFSIYFGTVSGSLTKLGDISAPNATYDVTGLTVNTTYYWRVDGTKANGSTVTGTEWSFKTLPTPLLAGDYRTVTSGTYSVATIWETFDGTNWIPATVPPPAFTYPATPTVNTVTVRAGHAVTLGGTTTITNLVVESTGSLKSDATVRNLRINKSVANYGSVGTSANRVNLEGYLDNGTITLGGTSKYYFTNFTVNMIAQTVEVVVDADEDISGYLRAYYSTATTTTTPNQSDDNITITINPGKTVTLVTNGTSAYLHQSNTTTITVGDYGNYTYNINGTLDMKATGTSCPVAHSTVASNLTINVNGIWYTGNAMRMATTATSPVGTVNYNIGNTGIVDAGARNAGAASTSTAPAITNLVVTNAPTTVFFNIAGNGALKNRVGTAEVLYPVGTNNTYSPVKLTNSGTIDLVSVALQNTFDNPVNDSSKVVNKQYTIKPNLMTGPVLAIGLGWLMADEATSFYNTSAVAIGHYGSGANNWDETAAIVSGSGTMASPYYAKALGFTAFSQFAVGDSSALVLQLKLLSFQAAYNGKQVDLAWTTKNEVDIKGFASERSTDGINFLKIGYFPAKNMVGTNNYTNADLSPLSGLSYYRLKIFDKDSLIILNKIININITPIKLPLFQATYSGKQVDLAWTTENELNVKGFLLERSTDGTNFSAIGNVAAKNTVGTNNYAYADLLPLSGLSYYRLKIIHNDGSVLLDKIININILPLKLSLFQAAYNSKQVDLAWTTENEVNVKGFLLERSTDGSNFSAIGNIAAKNTVGANSYGFADSMPLLGVLYYRLKIVHKDGSVLLDKTININILALKLPLFQAAYNGKQVDLAWTTENEVNVKGFLLERSADGTNFLAIGNIAARNAAGANNYGFVDSVPLSGLSYYRLKMIDKDDSVVLDKVVNVDVKISQALSVFPNPAHNKVTINYTTVSKSATMDIYTIGGNLVKRVVLASGTAQAQVEIGDLANGNYLVRINDGGISTLMFIKQ